MPTIFAVEELLGRELSWPNAINVDKIGEGAWSTAFGFQAGERQLVIRLGQHGSDFRRDQEMARLAAPGLPIPEVLDVGQTTRSGPAAGLHYCVSAKAFGTPLESCSTEEWPTIAEHVADSLEAMRVWTLDSQPTARPNATSCRGTTNCS